MRVRPVYGPIIMKTITVPMFATWMATNCKLSVTHLNEDFY